jgi:hypothetical protein
MPLSVGGAMHDVQFEFGAIDRRLMEVEPAPPGDVD